MSCHRKFKSYLRFVTFVIDLRRCGVRGSTLALHASSKDSISFSVNYRRSNTYFNAHIAEWLSVGLVNLRPEFNSSYEQISLN